MLVEELRIGSLEDADYGFSSIGGVHVDAEDRIYVFESQDLQIRVYSPEGALMRRIGGRGDGPGEFRFGAAFGVVGDTVWAVESPPGSFGRMTLFDREGRVLATGRFEGVVMPWHREGETAALVPWVMQPGGRFVSFAQPRGWPAGAGEPAVVRPTIDVPRVRFSVTGSVVDTVGWYTASTPISRGTEIEVGQSHYWIPGPPFPVPSVIMIPEGRVLLDTLAVPARAGEAEFQVMWLDLSDEAVRRRTFRYRPMPYSDAQFNASVAAYVRQGRAAVAPLGAETLPLARAADSAAAHTAIRERLHRPEFNRPWRRTHVGSDGALWLEREDTGAETFRWLVLDAEGLPRGELELPRSGFRIAWSQGDLFLAVETDDLGVPWLVRYRIEGVGG